MKRFILRILFALATFFVLSFIMSGCYTKKKALNKFCNTDSIVVIVRDTIKVNVYIKSDSSGFQFDCRKFQLVYDSLLKISSKSIDSSGFLNVHETKKNRISVKPEVDGTLSFKVVNLADTIYRNIPIYIEVKAPCTEKKYSTLDHVRKSKFIIILAFVSGMALAFYMKFRK
jgi:hypothetical protein